MPATSTLPLITAEKAALFIACDFSTDWLVRHGSPRGRALATSAEWNTWCWTTWRRPAACDGST